MAGSELYFVKDLGKGAFGSVSLFIGRRDDGKTFCVAVKTSDENHAVPLFKEFRILSKFRGCSRIVQCYGEKVKGILNEQGCVDYKMPMEYAAGGSLYTFFGQFQDRKLPDPLIKDFTRMLLEGLATIHSKGYVHCDIKPENILVFPTCVYENGTCRTSLELKISDFGLCRREGESKWWTPRRPFAGTSIYMSPESVLHGETGKALDLWSLGCIVLEMYTGKGPWWHTNYEVDDLLDGETPLIPSWLPIHAKLFILTCFDSRTERRKDAPRLMKHIFVRGDGNTITEPSVNDQRKEQVALELTKFLRQELSLQRRVCAYPKSCLTRPSRPSFALVPTPHLSITSCL